MSSILYEAMLLAKEGDNLPAGPWYQETWLLLAATGAALALAVFCGFALSKAMRNTDYTWRGALIVFSLLVSIVIIAGNWPPRFGVDLKGGTTFIAQIVEEEGENNVTVEEVITALKKRIDPSGVYEIVLRPLGRDKIEIIIPDVDNEEAERIWSRVVKTGHLQYMIVSDNQFTSHAKVQRLAREQAESPYKSSQGGFVPKRNEVYDLVEDKDTGETKVGVVGRWVELGRVEVKSEKANAKGPYKFMPSQSSLIRDQRSGKIIDWNDAFLTGLKMPSADSDDGGVELEKWALSQGYKQLEILMMTDRYNVEGRHLATSRSEYDSEGKPSVSFTMNSEGAKLFGGLTRTNKPDKSSNPPKYKSLGIVLDNELLSSARLLGVIRDQGQITGSFEQREVDDLVAILKGGRLKAAIAPTPVAQDKVESSIGREMKERGLFAIGISFAAVLVFMIFYYRFAGIVACLALIANLIFIVALIMSIKFPFSLTGLAGLVLTVGMSVDANVLIFERIREEIDKGATLRMAIRNGFAKATTTIVDANLTTLITAVILYVIGTEQIKGFAVALILGILMSMFTAIFCSRVAFDLAERKRWITKLGMMRFVGATKFDFINLRAMAAVMSGILIIVGFVALFGRGATILAHDMAGGTTARVVFKTAPEGGVDYVRSQLRETFEQEINDNLDHEVEVSEVQSWDPNDPNAGFPQGTVFKVNTDLKLEDGTADQLALIIQKAFAGQLSMRGMKYKTLSGDAATQPNPNVGPVAPEPKDGGQKKAEDADAGKSADKADEASAKEEKSVDDPLEDENDCFVQDEADEKAADESATDKTEDSAADTKTDETDTKSGEAEAKTDETKSADADTKADDSESKASDNEKSEVGSSSDNTEAGSTGTAESEDGDAENNNSTSSATSGTYEMVADLTFNFPIGAEAVANTLSEAAADRFSISINPDDFEAEGYDGIDRTFPSTNWKVRFIANSKAEGEQVLDLAKERLDSKPYFQSLSGVGGAIAGESQRQAIAAILFSLIGIVAYIWIRFQKISFGLAAVVALVHDVLIVLGAIAISSWLKIIPGIDEFKISLPVIAAFMTIIGYSLNDTIVVFDRIRETRGKNPDLTREMINHSIGQTLSRTLLTSVTTFLVVFILFAIGGDTIHGFAFALVIGVIVGTYSSIFIASPVLYWLMGHQSVESKPAITKPGGQ